MEKLLIMLLLFLVTPLLGQKLYHGKAHPIRPLTEAHNYPKGQFFLQVKEQKDTVETDYDLIYFINSTDKEVVVQSYFGQIYPIRGIHKQEGKWLSLERRGWCGTGYGKSVIPANHYAWTRCFKTRGNYEAKVKYKLVVNDTVVFSPALTRFIYEPDKFGVYGQRIQAYEAALKEAGDVRKKSYYLTTIGKIWTSIKEYDRALENFEAAILLDSKNYEARYWKGNLYLKNLNNCGSFNKYLTQGIISATLAEWDFVPKGAEIYKFIQKNRAIYLEGLLTKAEWEMDNDLPFKLTEDGSKLYYIDCLVNDYIKITYKK